MKRKVSCIFFTSFKHRCGVDPHPAPNEGKSSSPPAPLHTPLLITYSSCLACLCPPSALSAPSSHLSHLSPLIPHQPTLIGRPSSATTTSQVVCVCVRVCVGRTGRLPISVAVRNAIGARKSKRETKGERHLLLDVFVPTPAAAVNVAERSEEIEELQLTE